MVRNINLVISLLSLIGIASLSSCCEPAHKDSTPQVVASTFQETYGRDVDLAEICDGAVTADSAYFPIYTFGIQNTGSQDDDYTLQYRIADGGFDITKHVPAGQTVLFKTPLLAQDSITINAKYTYPNLSNCVTRDTHPNLDYMYFRFSRQTTDSAEIHFLRPTVTILYGAIDNGPEACNTPASSMQINIDGLPHR